MGEKKTDLVFQRMEHVPLQIRHPRPQNLGDKLKEHLKKGQAMS